MFCFCCSVLRARHNFCLLSSNQIGTNVGNVRFYSVEPCFIISRSRTKTILVTVERRSCCCHKHNLRTSRHRQPKHRSKWDELKLHKTHLVLVRETSWLDSFWSPQTSRQRNLIWTRLENVPTQRLDNKTDPWLEKHHDVKFLVWSSQDSQLSLWKHPSLSPLQMLKQTWTSLGTAETWRDLQCKDVDDAHDKFEPFCGDWAHVPL